jgi:hypothetical protein
MTLNVGADERRTHSVSNLSTSGIWAVGADPADSHAGMQHPTPWINFAVNQAWGRFAVSAIFNNNTATYYTGAPGCPVGAQTGTTQCGHPDDKWGWAVLSGIDIKVPQIGPGDHIGAYFNYGVGATAYSAGSNLGSPGLFGSGNEVALGTITDAVYVNGGELELTTAWTAGGGYEHFWLPNVSSTVYGNYTRVTYNDNVVGSGWFCGQNGGALQNLRFVGAGACDPSFNYWTVGMVNNWYPVAGFRLAVDVLYIHIDTAFDGEQVNLIKAQGARPTGLYTAKDQDNISVVFRAQRSFGGGD